MMKLAIPTLMATLVSYDDYGDEIHLACDLPEQD